MSQLVKPARILEIGDYGGHLAKCLLERGFRVSVLSHHEWRSRLNGFSQPGPRPRVADSVEDEPTSERQHIFFHYDSFLEIVNEIGMRPLLTRLHELSDANSLICFDYPDASMPLSQGTIFSGRIASLGQVECRYSGHEKSNDLHKVRLEYIARQEHESFWVSTPLSFVAPEVAGVLALAQEVGFLSSAIPMAGAFSFLGGTLVLVELRRSKCSQKRIAFQ